MYLVFIPLVGTTLGAAMVFLMKEQLNATLEKTLLGLAAGVMIAASVWSLLIPSIELAEEQGKVGGEKGGQDVFHFNSENLQFHM